MALTVSDLSKLATNSKANQSVIDYCKRGQSELHSTELHRGLQGISRGVAGRRMDYKSLTELGQ